MKYNYYEKILNMELTKMAPHLSLDKLTFYKDDIENGKIYIKGDISGLDPNKQYCVMWLCTHGSGYNNMHGIGTDYFYLRNASSISLTYNEAHIHMDDIVWNTGEDYSNVYVFINEVNGNCETITDEFVAYKDIKVYDKYAPVETGTLNCTSYPTGAGIYINDSYYGLTNRDIDLDPGSYTVKFTKDGYEDFTQTKTITAGETTYISKNLIVEEEPTGILNCTSYPTGAGIYINDSYYGLTNRDIDLDPGSYTVKFTKSGYEDYTRTLTIEAGETTYISKNLIAKECPIPSATLSITLDNEIATGIISTNPGVEETINYAVLYVYDGEKYVEITDVDLTGEAKTITFTWNMITYGDCYFYLLLRNSCGDSSGWVTSDVLDYTEPCVPDWKCETPLNGYEEDGCGNRRTNADCEPCVPDWECETPLNGYETDGCGNRRTNADCEPYVPPCVPNWQCETPLNGYEEDGCGNRRYNADCEPCVPDWECETPLNGYETDGCGNRRTNADCEPYVPPCIPDWQCEVPLNGYEADGCGNRRHNADCEPYVPPYVPLEEELIEEPSYVIPIVIGAGVITAVGLFILSQKK